MISFVIICINTNITELCNRIKIRLPFNFSAVLVLFRLKGREMWEIFWRYARSIVYGSPRLSWGIRSVWVQWFLFCSVEFPTAQHVCIGEQGPRSILQLWREELVGRKEGLHSKDVSKRRRGKVKIMARYSPSNLRLHTIKFTVSILVRTWWLWKALTIQKTYLIIR